MIFNLLTLFVLLAPLVKGDGTTVVNDINKLVSIAKSMTDKLNGFDQSQGFNAAILIQTDAEDFSKNITSTTQDVEALSDATSSSAIAAALQQLADPVAVLIAALDAKVADFTALSAAGIVQVDLNNMSKGSGQLLAAVYGVTYCGNDGDIVGSVGSGIASGFVDAFSVYSNGPMTVSVVSSCVQAPVTTSSAAAVASSSVPDSSASASSSVPPASSTSPLASSPAAVASSLAAPSDPVSSDPASSVLSSTSSFASVSSSAAPSVALSASGIVNTTTTRSGEDQSAVTTYVTTYTTTQTFTDCPHCKNDISTRTAVVTETLTTCPSHNEPAAKPTNSLGTNDTPAISVGGGPLVAPDSPAISQPVVVAGASSVSMGLAVTLSALIAGALFY